VQTLFCSSYFFHTLLIFPSYRKTKNLLFFSFFSQNYYICTSSKSRAKQCSETRTATKSLPVTELPTLYVLSIKLLKEIYRFFSKKLKDLKDEVLVVTNAAEGNTPHVVEDIEPEGGLKTRPLAGAKPSDQFMRIDRNVSILETFFLNMKRQFERPSDFRFYHLPADLLASAKELVGLFKQPESNSALLDEYRLDTEQYVQSRQQAQQQSGGGGTEQSTRWSMEQVDWQQLERMGVTPETLGEPGLKRLLNGNESAVLTLKTVIEGIEFETPACIRLAENPDGTLRNEIECCKRYPELDTPYFNVEFTPEVKQNLLEKGNAGCVVELELAGGVREPCLVSLNPKTNRLHHIPVSGITIPAEVNGTALTDEQRKRIASGESVLVENMWSEKKQRHYDARLQFNACKGGFDYDFKGIARRQEQTAAQEQEQNRQQERGLVIPARLKGKDLTEEQQASLAQGKATYIKDMTDNEGNLFSAFVRVNHERAKFDFFKWNPDKSKKQEQSQQAAVRQDGTKPANAVSRNRPVQKADKKGVSI